MISIEKMYCFTHVKFHLERKMEDTKQDIDTKVETEEDVKTKRCPKCERVLPLSDFNKCKSSKDGRFCYCKDCKKELKKAYYAKHRGEILKKAATYRANNKDKIAEYQAEWLAKHPTYHAEYYKANKEEKKAYVKAHTDPQKNPMGYARNMVAQYRRMDKERGFDTSQTISAEWFLENIMYKPCAHCGKSEVGAIGANRLNNDLGHEASNLEPCCFKCNARENIRDQIERGLAWFQKRKKQSFKEFVEKHKAKNKNLS